MTAAIDAESVKAFARALGESDPLYLDDEAARKGPFGAIVAPPTYPIAFMAQAMSGLKLQMGSNDQGKVYLNGAQLLVFDKTRALAKDQNTANDVQLRKGENLLVFKVVNEKGAWQGCIRFTDRNNQPVRNLQISLTPQ